MNSRERIVKAINHQEADRLPVDLGGTVVTGIHASALDRLQKKLGIKNRLVKVYEPMMFLGQVELDVVEAIGGDVLGINSPVTLLGYKNENWKPWKLPDGTTVEMGEKFAFSYGPDGTIYAYPGGNQQVPPSAKMPSNGLYFDNIIRQKDLNGHAFNARIDYADQYSIYNDELCRYFEDTTKRLFNETDKALFGNFFLGGCGDVLHIPGPWLEDPQGIRDLELWITAPYDHPQYVKDFFALQTEIALENLKLFYQAVGDRVSVIAISGTDFGAQNGPFISPQTYREFFKPCHKILNDWVHQNTNWKVFFHSCGSIYDFLDDFIEVGVDIINPVQFSAARMDLKVLKNKYNDKLVFWGAGADPQETLPFGTPEEVEEEAKRSISILGKGGGYVFAAVHNIQSLVPIENILALFNAAKKYGKYPIM